MKKHIALIVSISALSFSAFAGEFDGLSAGINLNHTKAKTKLVDPAGPFDGYLQNNSTTGTVFGQYSYVADANVLLGVGATFDLNDTKLSATMKLKNHYSIYLEPGYILDKSTMIYGKVGYHVAKLHADDNGSVATANMNGVGYGIGVRTKLDNQFFLQAELEQIKYSQKTINTAQTTPHTPSIKVGIGYQF